MHMNLCMLSDVVELLPMFGDAHHNNHNRFRLAGRGGFDAFEEVVCRNQSIPICSILVDTNSTLFKEEEGEEGEGSVVVMYHAPLFTISLSSSSTSPPHLLSTSIRCVDTTTTITPTPPAPLHDDVVAHLFRRSSSSVGGRAAPPLRYPNRAWDVTIAGSKSPEAVEDYLGNLKSQMLLQGRQLGVISSSTASINIRSLTIEVSCPNEKSWRHLPDNFLGGQTSLRYINLSNLTHVTSIGSSFASYNSLCVSMSFSPLTCITSIGPYFLLGCEYLQELDLTAFSGLTVISEGFLSGCSRLGSSGSRMVDFAPLVNVERIGKGFLRGAFAYCGVATTTTQSSSSMPLPSGIVVNLSSLHKLKSIGEDFMVGCSSVGTVTFPPSTSLQPDVLPSNFLLDCSGLSSLIHFGALLSTIRIIDKNFMRGCRGVEVVNFEPSSMAALEIVKEGFMEGCTGLVSTNFGTCITRSDDDTPTTTPIESTPPPPPPYGRLHTIANNFMAGCTRLHSLNLNGAVSLTAVGDAFLAGCTSMCQVSFSPTTRLMHIGTYYMGSCRGLEGVDLTHLEGYTDAIPTGFLSNCTKLTAVDLAPLSSIHKVGGYFLENCVGLRHVDMSPFEGGGGGEGLPGGISNGFMAGCSGLVDPIDLTPLRHITSIPSGFLCKCTSIRHIDLSQYTSLTSVSHIGFLDGCTTSVRLPPTATTTPSETPLRAAIQRSVRTGCSHLTIL